MDGEFGSIHPRSFLFLQKSRAPPADPPQRSPRSRLSLRKILEQSYQQGRSNAGIREVKEQQFGHQTKRSQIGGKEQTLSEIANIRVQ